MAVWKLSWNGGFTYCKAGELVDTAVTITHGLGMQHVHATLLSTGMTFDI